MCIFFHLGEVNLTEVTLFTMGKRITLSPVGFDSGWFVTGLVGTLYSHHSPFSQTVSP